MSKTPSISTIENDRADVLDNPEWTAEDFARAKPFAEVFPDLARKMRDAKAEASIQTDEAARQRGK